MQRFANDSIEETPAGASSTIAQRLVSDVVVVSFVVSDALGLSSLSLIGLLITPGCG